MPRICASLIEASSSRASRPTLTRPDARARDDGALGSSSAGARSSPGSLCPTVVVFIHCSIVDQASVCHNRRQAGSGEKTRRTTFTYEAAWKTKRSRLMLVATLGLITKVVGSNPAPATKTWNPLSALRSAGFSISALENDAAVSRGGLRSSQLLVQWDRGAGRYFGAVFRSPAKRPTTAAGSAVPENAAPARAGGSVPAPSHCRGARLRVAPRH